MNHFKFEESLIHHIILKMINFNNYGLLNGKIGIAIAFFNYGKYSKNKVLTELADELIDGILTKINKKIGIGLDNGFSGIGWGIEYLIQKNFVEADSNKACKDIDEIIMETDVRRMYDLSLKTGIEGVMHYVLARIKGALMQNNDIPFDELYLNDIQKTLLKINKTSTAPSLFSLIEKFDEFINKGVCNYELYIESLIEYIDIKENDIINAKLGLNEGLAGKLLHIAIH